MQIKAENEILQQCLNDLEHHALEVRNTKDGLGLL